MAQLPSAIIQDGEENIGKSSNAMVRNMDIEAFLEWFQSNGGFFDSQVMGITEFPDRGRGAIALRDIPVGHTLFALPRALTLSTRTSPLPSLFGLEAWRNHGLHKGWVGLILCLMWEDAWAHELDIKDGYGDIQLKWGPYVRTLPTTFDTPMFWSVEELEELRGTAVIDKLGRDDAERAYSDQLVPAIKTSPTLFPPSHRGKWYTLDAYHRAGSRILSRSFTVGGLTDDDDDAEDGGAEVEGSDADEAKGPEPKRSVESPMDIDDARSSLGDTNEEMGSDPEDSEDHVVSGVAMVPMADLLNARWGNENAKLFREPILLRMVTTRKVREGEEILNTYGDPPNSDLLRRYGHVDMVRLHSPSCVPTSGTHDLEMEDGDADIEVIQHLGNPSDVVEIRADLIVDVVRAASFGSRTEDLHARIEWWLNEGEDDVFVLGLFEPDSQLSANLPPGLISFIRLLFLSEPDFESTRSRGKLPKGKLKKTDAKDNKEVLEILDEVLKRREKMYVEGSVEDDEHLLSITKTLTNRKRHAVIVRLGEKRILRNVKQIVGMMLAELSFMSGDARKNEKDHTRHQKGGNGGKETKRCRQRVASGTEGDRGYKKARK